MWLPNRAKRLSSPAHWLQVAAKHLLSRQMSNANPSNALQYFLFLWNIFAIEILARQQERLTLFTRLSQIPEWGLANQVAAEVETSLEVLHASAAAFVKVPQLTSRTRQVLLFTCSEIHIHKIGTATLRRPSVSPRRPLRNSVTHTSMCVGKQACLYMSVCSQRRFMLQF